MRILIVPLITYLFLLFTFHSTTQAEGFLKGTLVTTPHGCVSIEDIRVGDMVVGHADCQRKIVRVKAIHRKEVDHYYAIKTGEQVIACDAEQRFLHVECDCWVQARYLQAGQQLLSLDDKKFLIDDIQRITVEEKVTLTSLTVDQTHNFCISQDEILVHNIEPLITLTACWVFGQGISLALGGVAAWIAAHMGKKFIRSMEKKRYFDAQILHANQDKGSDAQAPGQPTEKDGYVPPKKWDGKKIKHRRGYGYPDRNGSIWIPSGPGPQAHGGPYWDVQHGDGTYDNIMPGGHLRGKKNK